MYYSEKIDTIQKIFAFAKQYKLFVKLIDCYIRFLFRPIFPKKENLDFCWIFQSSLPGHVVTSLNLLWVEKHKRKLFKSLLSRLLYEIVFNGL